MLLNMAQVMIYAKKSAFTQTGEEAHIYYIDDTKSVKMYYSTVYKERVCYLSNDP